ncbi:hypothetical protein [Brucella anthropi]|uniref:hypothetical protein n=1 Tax=Brucella anthropi TaxID=529 RepID=UPI0039859F5F
MKKKLRRSTLPASQRKRIPKSVKRLSDRMRGSNQRNRAFPVLQEKQEMLDLPEGGVQIHGL